MANLTLRSLARLAEVNRSYPPVLQKDGLIADPPSLEDVVVTRALAAIPGRWFMGGRSDGVLDPRSVAGLVRQGLVPANSGATSEVVLIITRGRAALVDRQAAAVSLADTGEELLVLPIWQWWKTLRSEWPAATEVAMTG